MRSDVDDAALGGLKVELGVLQKLEQEVFNVLADVAGLGERGGVADGKRDVDHAGQRPGQQGLARAGRAQEQDVGLLDFDVQFLFRRGRLARSTVDAIQIGTRLEKAGADLVSLSESIETHTAAGRMVFKLLAVMGEFERDLLSERTRSALGYKRSKGQRISGKIPFGYVLNDDGETLSPSPSEQEGLVLIRKLHGQGMSLRRICAVLTATNTPNKSGLVRWTPSRIQGILRRSDACTPVHQGTSA